jgi:hypothetical protein
MKLIKKLNELVALAVHMMIIEFESNNQFQFQFPLPLPLLLQLQLQSRRPGHGCHTFLILIDHPQLILFLVSIPILIHVLVILTYFYNLFPVIVAVVIHAVYIKYIIVNVSIYISV